MEHTPTNHTVADPISQSSQKIQSSGTSKVYALLDYWLPLVTIMTNNSVLNDYHSEYLLGKLSDTLKAKKWHSKTYVSIYENILFPLMINLTNSQTSVSNYGIRLEQLIKLMSEVFFKYNCLLALNGQFIKNLVPFVKIYIEDKRNIGLDILESYCINYGSFFTNEIWGLVVESISATMDYLINELTQINASQSKKPKYVSILSVERFISNVIKTHTLLYDHAINLSLNLEKASALTQSITEQDSLLMEIEKGRLLGEIMLFNTLKSQQSKDRSQAKERFYEYDNKIGLLGSWPQIIFSCRNRRRAFFWRNTR